MIYTVTLNPSLDYHLRTSALITGATNRASSESLTLGGKGINVSLMLTRLGMPNVAWGFVAGFTGDELCRRMSEAGLSHDMIRLDEGMTRINVKLHHGDETEINGVGASIPSAALEALKEKIAALVGGDILVLSGSVPSGLPKGIYADIMGLAADRGLRFVVDAEGDALKATLPRHPFLVKPNLRELSALAGRDLTTRDDVISAAEDLRLAGAQNVLVSMGKWGAILLDGDGGIHVSPAVGGTPINTVGAGDSMVAGFLVGLTEGYAQALRMGLAAGGATACSEGIGSREAVLSLYRMA